MKLLVVEDNVLNMELLVDYLRAHGHEVLQASSGAQCLEMMRQCHPHLILMDIGLPDMSGYDALQQLRALDNAPGAPVVAVTAHAMKGERGRAIAAGFDDYLTKPIVFGELRAVLDRYEPSQENHDDD